MIITVTRSLFVRTFEEVRPDQFSRTALHILFDYLDDRDESTGSVTEFCPIEVSCDWTEYDTALEAAMAYGYTPAPQEGDEDADEYDDRVQADAYDWLCMQTTVLRNEGDDLVVVENF